VGDAGDSDSCSPRVSRSGQRKSEIVGRAHLWHAAAARPSSPVGAIRGRISSVPLFLETIVLPSGAQPVCLEPDFCADPGPGIETRLSSNGIVIDLDVPLFADGQ